jgi:DNA polymerase-3 subunit delta
MAVITITGENSYLRSAELRKVVDGFVAANGDLALERLDGEEADFVRINEALTSLPFLANKKMVLLSRPSGNKQFAENAPELLKDLPDTTELVLAEPKFDKRSSLYKLLKKETDFREFAALDGFGLASWLVGQAKERGATLSPTDARYLVERVGANQQQLASELEKLRLYDPKISRQHIDASTDPTPQSKIFDLIDAAFAGNTKRAMQLYDEQRKLKVDPLQIIAMFAWQLHVLALLVTAGGKSADEVARTAKMSPYVVGKSQHLANRLSPAKVKVLVDRLLDIDARSKRQSLDLDDALRHYILAMN